MSKILITGTAGFIGYSLAERLLCDGFVVSGIDNHNDYYDPDLKRSRVQRLQRYNKYAHNEFDLTDRGKLADCFSDFKPDIVINLAAQAGVRYSLENPSTYIESNISGFANILECCRNNRVRHLLYASSSSVYGANKRLPLSVRHGVDHPLSLYAATKKSNELMAHAYSNLFDLPTTGLRFFTVYGPWGRPDMALFKFTRAMLNNDAIQIYNNGNHRRDFTYVDDVVEAIARLLHSQPSGRENADTDPANPSVSRAPWAIYNIGNGKPILLSEYIEAIEKKLGKIAKKEYLPLQPGDVEETHADIQELVAATGFRPNTSVDVGISNFIDWYLSYYGK